MISNFLYHSGIEEGEIMSVKMYPTLYRWNEAGRKKQLHYLQQNKIELLSVCGNSYVVSTKNCNFEIFYADAYLYILN